jgi:replicative DNA helicase
MREREVAEISRAAKALAAELSVPVIMAAQLNREVEKREKPVPRLADLRESGAIEQDADIVLLLFGDDDIRLAGAHGPVVHLRPIQRDGDTVTVPVKYERAYTRFSDCESEG